MFSRCAPIWRCASPVCTSAKYVSTSGLMTSQFAFSTLSALMALRSGSVVVDRPCHQSPAVSGDFAHIHALQGILSPFSHCESQVHYSLPRWSRISSDRQSRRVRQCHRSSPSWRRLTTRGEWIGPRPPRADRRRG
jgi:hypothetical protein